MDYIFADPVLVTPENRKLLAEEVIDLPNFLGLWLPQSVPEPKSLGTVAWPHHIRFVQSAH